MGIKNQLRSVIQWENPQPWQLFHRFTERGDELKNASKLVLQPGQGCIFTYEGKIEGVFDEEGMYDINTDNKPFITTIKKFMNAFESEHKDRIVALVIIPYKLTMRKPFLPIL